MSEIIKINNKFPVLWDVNIAGKITKGFYNYDKNIFEIPIKKYNIINQHFKSDMNIIKSIGYEINS